MQLPVIDRRLSHPRRRRATICIALEVLQQILSSGESSRLYQRLVRKDKTGGVRRAAFVFEHEDPGLFLTFARVSAGQRRRTRSRRRSTRRSRK